MAEVYWDLEWTLQQQGFDYTYDKRLYDRLREGHARPVREHFHAGLDYQNKLARFLENHDEPRAAATFPPGRAPGGGRHHLPVARAAFLPSGAVRGTHESGSRRISAEGRHEPTDQHAAAVLRSAARRAAAARRPRRPVAVAGVHARPGTGTGPGIASWPSPGRRPGDDRLLVAVNFAPNQSQCYVRLPFADLAGRQWRLQDQMADASTIAMASNCRTADCTWMSRPWQASVFALTRQSL